MEAQTQFPSEKRKWKNTSILYKGYEAFAAMDGKQPGDPDRIGQVFLTLVNSVRPPARLFLGSDAYHRAESKIKFLTEEMQEWKQVSVSTDFSH